MTTEEAPVKFYLVGLVPVRMQELPDGGVAVLAFNPLLGGFVGDARYYVSVKYGDDVKEISEAEYLEQIEVLKNSGLDQAEFEAQVAQMRLMEAEPLD